MAERGMGEEKNPKVQHAQACVMYRMVTYWGEGPQSEKNSRVKGARALVVRGSVTSWVRRGWYLYQLITNLE